MNTRDRHLATIRHEIPDRISVDAIAIETQSEIGHLWCIERSAVLDRLGTDGRVILAPYMGAPDQPAGRLAEFPARAECVYLGGPDHHIKPDVPHVNTLALFDAAREFRRAGYTR